MNVIAPILNTGVGFGGPFGDTNSNIIFFLYNFISFIFSYSYFIF